MIETNAELDDELRRLMAVDPSPEFGARVRRRFAEEPPQAVASPAIWWITATATLAAVTAAVFLSMRAPAQPSQPLTARAIAAPSIRLEPGQVTDLRHQSLTGRPHGRSDALHASRAEPEILIDQHEANAIRAFLDGLHDGFEVTPISPLVRGPDLVFTDNIEIIPIAIDPLTAATALQGVRP